MTTEEIKAKVAALIISYTGGVDEVKLKEVLDDIADSLGTGVANLDIEEVPRSGDFSISEVDAYKLYVVNSASAVTITVPSGLTAGKWWEVLTIGAGQISFVAGSGATIISPDNRLKIRAQYSTARVIARASNQVSLGGDLVI